MKKIIVRAFCYISLTLLVFIWFMGTLASITDYYRYYRDDPPTLTLAETKQRLQNQARIWVRIKDAVWFCDTIKPIKGPRSSATKIIFTDPSGSDIVFAEFSHLYTCDELQNMTADGTLSIIKNPDQDVLRKSQVLSKGDGVIFELCGHCNRTENLIGGIFIIVVFPIIMVSIFVYNSHKDRQTQLQQQNAR